SLTIGYTSTINAGFTIGTAGTLILNNASLAGSGNLADQGTLIGQGNSTINIAFNNGGTLNIGIGSILKLMGAFSNFSGGTLTGGTYIIDGTFQFTGANIVTNAATVVLDSSSARIIDQSSSNALANFATNAATGSFTIQNGRNFTTGAAIAFG